MSYHFYFRPHDLCKMFRWTILLIAAVVAIVHADEPERIVDGTQVEAGELPYQVHLDQYGQFMCGGSLITTMHVLTAAHCVLNVLSNPGNLVVLTGSIELEAGQKHKVKEIYSHPKFVLSEQTSFAYDIAVIVLEKPIEVTPYQAPISIASGNTPVGAVGVVSGWGRPDLWNPPSQILMKRPVTIVSRKTCAEGQRAIIYPSQICGFDGVNTGFCKGDSGGPLVYNNEVVGIVSWTFPCGRGAPDVYTNVYYYRDFINDVISRTTA